MMPDIFSSFDPYMYNTLLPSNSMFLMMNTLIILMLQSSFWLMNSRISTLKSPVKDTIFTQLSRTSGLHLKGLSSVLSAIFILLVVVNLMGLIPYTFSTSSHLIFTLTLGLPPISQVFAYWLHLWQEHSAIYKSNNMNLSNMVKNNERLSWQD